MNTCISEHTTKMRHNRMFVNLAATYIQMRIFIYRQIYTYMCMYIYTCMYRCMMYIHTYIHTYMHAYIYIYAHITYVTNIGFRHTHLLT